MIREIPKGWNWNEKEGYGFLPIHGEGYSPVPYDGSYFQNYQNMAGTTIGNRINGLRVQMVMDYLKWNTESDPILLDVGIGCGAFVAEMRSEGANIYGTDVNTRAISWLSQRGWLMTIPQKVNVMTLWDVLEHIEDPASLLVKCDPELVFISMPIYFDEQDALTSKHFKPGEHCWYFTQDGLEKFMLIRFGYGVIEVNWKESILAGRESIGSFAFKKIK